MIDFREFLHRRLETGGFSTEDALASFLPLAREVQEAHSNGWVAPLRGVGDLSVDGVRVWYPESKRVRPSNGQGVERVQRAGRAVFDVVAEHRVTTEVDDGSAHVVNMAVGDPEQSITRPVYLPSYEAWEHHLGRHDPLTDVFSLGMLLASLTCGMDLGEPEPLVQFVSHRKNLFALTDALHPVVARVIVRMTELDRHRRAPDLASLIATLENYRDHEIDFEFDLAATKGFAERPKRDKRTVVLTKLRERLFEISRRNRLLHFRPTMQSINLTQASIPLSFDINSIRPEQVLTWGDDLEREVAKGRKVSLNKYLNFSEVLYLPSQLERLLAEARRDRAEFGFAQLRLVACFLHWANLKEEPVHQYESPLVLIPVQLKKKKGIRDTYTIEPHGSEAEINPVVRHQFKQLYDIELPETIDLSTTTLSALYEDLKRRIESSEAAVTLNKIDRPRIQLLHERARRKLDQYRKKARLAGRGVRKFLDLDYSYDAANYHPLGIKLYSALVKPPTTHLRTIVDEMPQPRTFVRAEIDTPIVEKERQTYVLQSGTEASPYDWTFDLCSVTLANFKYRRMSLVRDYDSLLATEHENPAFEAVFSLAPRPTRQQPRDSVSLDDRYDVVPCDPTQATAIADAAAGKSYIIQGPPGTGKSQTITNLIADFIARGKRVLFVCEKRAAIDVVYARLKQVGLGDLCCLIHDSQADKKEFVMGLKQTYEKFCSESDHQEQAAKRRQHTLSTLGESLKPLERFDRLMQAIPPFLGVTVRELIGRCVELRGMGPEVDAVTSERLPTYREWIDARETVQRFEEALRHAGTEPVLARHPLRLLSSQLAEVERPFKRLTEAVKLAIPLLEQTEATLARCGVPREQWERIGNAEVLTDYAVRISPLTEVDAHHVLDSHHAQATAFEDVAKALSEARSKFDQIALKNKHWVNPLEPDETEIALEQARAFEGNMLGWLRPTWWRLRSVMRSGYDFAAHKIRPSWVNVLRQLQSQHQAQAACDDQLLAVAKLLDVELRDAEAIVDVIERVRMWIPRQSPGLRKIHEAVLRAARGNEVVAQLKQAASSLNEVFATLEGIADGYRQMTFEETRTALGYALGETDGVRDFLDALKKLNAAPDSVREALRTLPCTPLEIEARIARNSLAAAYRDDREAARFTAADLQSHIKELERSYDDWQRQNADEIRQRVKKRFLEHLAISESPAAKLAADQKSFKQDYSRGRRQLEHEFGKQMRYKPIRDLVSGETGLVVDDIKPVWLMSPLSVSDTLPLDTDRFDVVVFDEASQITLEEAAPALCRARQSIVVGDEMQLPPTDFFSSKHSADEEDETLVESNGELVQYDLDAGSFLNHAAKNLPSTMLGWHYRSRSESLISFSNWAFYDGRLLTVPEECLPGVARTPIVAETKEDGAAGAQAALERAISFHAVPYGVYEKRRNRGEAEYIAEMVRGLLDDGSPTIGIVAFSEAQQDEIEQAIARQAAEDKEFGKRLESEYEREEDGQFVGMLVKNLENIQGDERDIIILSVCYGRPPSGKMRMNFGPINRSGGEKRLNVAFSRAKRHMAVVSSIGSAEITNEYNDGANCLKNYLRYAEAVSVGESQVTEGVLHGLSRWREQSSEEIAPSDTVADRLADALRHRGYRVDHAVGQSHFRCDLAIARPGDTAYRLGVLIDSARYYQQGDLIERDMMRPRLLRAFGWAVCRVLAKDFCARPDNVIAELVQRLEA